MKLVSWCRVTGLVPAGFHQIVSTPMRTPSQPVSAQAARPISGDRASLATVRSAFQALLM